jgi:gamma-glutamyltranspeptidase
METDVEELKTLVNELLGLTQLDQMQSMPRQSFALAPLLQDCAPPAPLHQQFSASIAGDLGELQGDARLLARAALVGGTASREGQPVIACGTPGGDQQDQWQLLFLLRVLVGGSSLQEAIDAPMWHTTSLPESFYPRGSEPGVLVVEDRLGDEVIDGLTARGHDVRRAGPWTLGRMCAVARDPATGVLSAAANPRGMQGYACGR